MTRHHAAMKDDDDELEEREIRRREERERHAVGWRRNILGVVLLALLVWCLWLAWK